MCYKENISANLDDVKFFSDTTFNFLKCKISFAFNIMHDWRAVKFLLAAISIRVTICQLSDITFIFAQYSFSNSFRHGLYTFTYAVYLHTLFSLKSRGKIYVHNNL